MKVDKTPLPGVVIITPKVFGDARGFFQETYSHRRYQEEVGITLPLVQVNHSRSALGTIRGLHYQLQHPQGKLLWVVSGEILDVAVDIRLGSPTFGVCHVEVLSEANHAQIYIPPGFAHGFAVLSQSADVIYHCTDYYHPQDEYGIRWDDPRLAIPWPRFDEPLLSSKDRSNPLLGEVAQGHLPRYG